MTETFNIEKAKHEIEAKRSAVRRNVTYGTIFANLSLASIALVWFLYAGRYEIALGVLASIMGLTGSITGFWFGARKPKEGDVEKSLEEKKAVQSDSSIGKSG